jgi:hypothetical protein
VTASRQVASSSSNVTNHDQQAQDVREPDDDLGFLTDDELVDEGQQSQYAEPHDGDLFEIDEEGRIPFIPGDDDEDDESGEPDEILAGTDEGDEPSEISVIGQYLRKVLDNVKRGDYDNKFKAGDFWILPSHPVKTVLSAMESGGKLHPSAFYIPRIFVFAVDMAYPHILIKCPDCSSANTVATKGWTRRIRRIIDMEDSFYLIARNYVCKKCPQNGNKNREFLLTTEAVVQSLPMEVSLQFPAVLTHKSGVSIAVAELLESGPDNALGPAKIRNILMEKHTLRHTKYEIMYYSCIQTILKLQTANPHVLNLKRAVSMALSPNEKHELLPPFCAFKDENGYNGFVPTSGYLRSLFHTLTMRKHKFFDLEMQRRGGQVLCFDGSFKVLKRIHQVNGHKTFGALISSQNEYGEVRHQYLGQSSSWCYYEQALIDSFETYKVLKQPKPHLAYTDNCCKDRDFFESVIPTLRLGLKSFKKLSIPGGDASIFIASNFTAAANLSRRLEQQIQASPNKVLGLDAEWNIGSQGIDMLQICLDHSVYLFHLALTGPALPIALRTILEDQAILKVGVNVGGDLARLNRQFRITCAGKFNLSGWLRRGLPGLFQNVQGISLQCAVQRILGYDLDKSESGPRVSDWRRKQLTRSQRTYAAIDAYASVEVYRKALEMIKGQRQFANHPIVQVVDPEDDESPTTSEAPSLDTSDHHTRVKLDAYHAMARIVVPRHHPYQYELCKSLRNALFELNDDDKEAVDRYLQTIGTNFERKFESDPDWIQQRVRRLIPPPEQLVPRLQAVYDEFTKAKYRDPKTQKHLLDDEARGVFRNVIEHATKGCLSDPPDIQLYFKTKIDQHKLQVYRCIRGTSSLEEFHQKLMLKIQMWNASPIHVHDVLANFRHRYNIRASERNRPDFPSIGHYDHHLIDRIQLLTRNIYGCGIHRWWKPAVGSRDLPETFGVIPCVNPAEYEVVTDHDVKDYPPTMKFLAQRMKTKIPHLPIQTETEMRLYNASVLSYIPVNGSEAGIDFNSMANDWNSGKLQFVGDRIIYQISHDAVRQKLPEHLRSYYRHYSRASERKLCVRAERAAFATVANTIQAIGTGDAGFLEPATAQNIMSDDEEGDADIGDDSDATIDEAEDNPSHPLVSMNFAPRTLPLREIPSNGSINLAQVKASANKLCLLCGKRKFMSDHQGNVVHGCDGGYRNFLCPRYVAPNQNS